jgi:membrane protease YdiL (CAAX protease family)
MRPDVQARMGVGEGTVIAFVSYLIFVVSSLILYYVLPLKPGAAIASGMLLAAAYYLVRRVVGRPWDYVRLKNLKPRIAVYTVLGTLALIPLTIFLMGIVVSIFDIPEEWLQAAYELIRAESLLELSLVWVVSGLLVPIGEEFVFRGVFQNSLMSRFHPAIAVLIASGVFAVLHVWRFPAAFVLGALMGTLYAVTGSLLAPVISHITINSVVVVVSYLAERIPAEAYPEWLLEWFAEIASAPVLVLGGSLAAFLVFMQLIWKESRPLSAPPQNDSGLPGEGAL